MYNCGVRVIPLNAMSLYADLAQNMNIGAAGTVGVKVVAGRRYLYAVERQGMIWKQRSIGQEVEGDDLLTVLRLAEIA